MPAPIPRIPPNYGQTRNQRERGMWEETTDQYLLRIEQDASIGQITLADLSTADKVALFGGGALVLLAIIGRDVFRNGKH